MAAGEPLFVVHLDPARGRVIVGPREALETHKVTLRALNWLGDGALEDIPATGLEVFAKVRSTRPPKPAILSHQNGVTSVELVDGESGIAPGQACVLYSDESDSARVLGGGYIANSQRAPEAEAMLEKLAAAE